ncbi:filamentous hemagglutinin N-terminal domain-containing protein [uncultured Selenomonas sp.]|uniref:filamentous hemagglutinin N-terminal domain-containing protein n=1 Tax=uncultured Selenomonas sp. TaxID=159275 RepID=UPI0025CF0F37|nr:filamentous hemagglutinin N-terminal domain-containing protein [uncultured Selenomonas sp.]
MLKNKKWNKKCRALAMAITFALSTGTAFAMPTGGTLVSGSVDGLVAGTIASGTTLVTKANSIIHWNTFDIANGEDLYVTTWGGGLLNYVTGTTPSTIAGYLTQSGSNPMLLINPNGITISGTATVYGGDLILSTLTLSDSDFANLMAGKTVTFSKSGATEGAITAEKGASIGMNAAIGERSLLLLAGGTMEIADGVTYYSSSDGNNDDAMIENLAADAFTFTKKDNDHVHDVMGTITTTTENTMAFHGKFSNDLSYETANTNFHIDGGVVNLDNANIQLNDASEAYLMAGQMTGSETVPGTATAENTLTATNLTVNGGKIVGIFSGKTTLTDSSITSDASAANLTIGSGTTATMTNNEDYNLDQLLPGTATAENVTTLTNTAVTNKEGELSIEGGKVVLSGATLTSDDTVNVGAFTTAPENESDIVKCVSDGNVVTMKDSTKITSNDGYIYGYTIEKSPSVTISLTEDNLIADHTYDGKTNSTPIVIPDTGETPSTPDTPSTPAEGDVISTTQMTAQNLVTNETAQASSAAGTTSNSSAKLPSKNEDSSDGVSLPSLGADTASLVDQTVGASLAEGNAQFASFVQQNIERGYNAMQDALMADTPEGRREQASAVAQSVDEDKTIDEGAKLAQAYGMIQAVEENRTMSAQEKAALKNMIAGSFRSLSTNVKTYLLSVAQTATARNE